MSSYFFSVRKRLQFKLFLVDLLLIAFSLVAAYCIRLLLDYGYLSLPRLWGRIHAVSLVFFVIHPFMLYISGLYSVDQQDKEIRLLLKVILTVLAGGAVIATVLFFFPRFLVGRKIVLFHLPVLSFLLYSWRVWMLKKYRRSRRRTKLALFGRGDIISSFVEEMNDEPYSEYEVQYVCIEDPKKRGRVWKGNRDLDVVGSVKDLLDHHVVEAIAVDTGLALSNEDAKRILDFRFHNDKEVYDLTELYQSITGKVPVSYIDGRWFISKPGFQGAPNVGYLKIKRLVDLILAIGIGLMTFPLMIMATITVKLESKGPIFYIQERLGKNRQPFRCYKFRTMVYDAEESSGPVHSKNEDSRTTRMGRLLRKTRLDELPQILNIVSGELSFVGPRPIREHFARTFSERVPFYELRYNVKPGLTGWAQVHGCYAVPYGLEALQYELFYIQNMSLFLDLHILFRTLRTVFGGKGK